MSVQEALDFAKHHSISTFETSAKTGKNVNEAFSSLSQNVYDKIKVSKCQELLLELMLALAHPLQPNVGESGF